MNIGLFVNPLLDYATIAAQCATKVLLKTHSH